MIVKETGSIVIMGACGGGRKLRLDLQLMYFMKAPFNKIAISNSLACKWIRGRLSIIVVDE